MPAFGLQRRILSKRGIGSSPNSHGLLLLDCASQPCYNGGTCRDQEQGYLCSCSPDYSGLQCQDEESSCNATTCNDRTMCKNEPSQGQFTCLCRTGCTGPNCSSTLDPCADNPCSNSAKCIPLKQGRFKCVCRAGWVLSVTKMWTIAPHHLAYWAVAVRI
jgi:hypothetical protein